MANTSSRSFRLLSLLQNHRYWAGAELAARLEVSPRTLRRDVDRLRDLGYPVTAHPGVDGGYQLAPGAVLPPLVVDDDEAVALVVGLLRAAQDAVGTPDTFDREPAIAEAAARALAKVSQVMPARLRRRAEAVAAMTEAATWDVSAGPAGSTAIDPDVLAGTALACRDAERIRFGYVAATGERTERHAEPHRLVALERRWYLVAYDLTRQDWRSFRLDRIAGAVTPTGARFRPRDLPAPTAAEFVRRNITGSGPADQVDSAEPVEAVVSAPAAAVRGRIGRWAAVTDQGADRCLVTMAPPAGSDWAIIALGLTGADFRIIGPPELAAQVGAWADRFARAATGRADGAGGGGGGSAGGGGGSAGG